MEEQELKDALAKLALDVQGKSSAEIKQAVADFETKNNEAIAVQIKGVRTELEAKLEAMQKHADALDARMQAKTAQDVQGGDELKTLITDNYDSIKTVRKGQAVKLEVKVVGNMTLGASLTGDAPRSYQSNVAGIPAQPLNFSDLVTTIPIEGGTYTFPRETAGEGSVTTQTEGSAKSQIDYDFAMIDVNTDFLAGFAVYSKKMANNLPFLENYLPQALRRDYFKAENAAFYASLVTNSTASTLTAGNIVNRIITEQVKLLGLNFMPNAIVINPADYGKILLTAGPAGTGDYSLPGVVSISNGVVSVNGLNVYVASWVPADKYIIGDWSQANKIVTQGLGVEFFEQDSDNVRKNNITARVEAQVALAVQRTDAFISGDFTAVA